MADTGHGHDHHNRADEREEHAGHAEHEEGRGHADHGEHGHTHRGGQAHTHGALDPALLTTERGLWAVKWSFIGLMVTAVLQLLVVVATGSVALMADTIHNFGDAVTAVPLWIAFMASRLAATKRFTYGYGRVEDLAGMVIVAMILLSGVAAFLQSVDRLATPPVIQHLWVVALAGALGFVGNEAVALFRIRVGEEIGSAALVADGHHARTDGLTSLGVLVGVGGVALGYPIADPLIGLVISLLIFRIAWESGQSVFSRLLDGVDPEVVDEAREVASGVAGVTTVSEVRVRWLGHRLLAELNLAVNPDLSVVRAHEIAAEVHHQLLHRLNYLSSAVIHIDPEPAAGESHHRAAGHEHDDMAAHSH